MFEQNNRQYDSIDFLCAVCSILVMSIMIFSIILFAQNAYAGAETENISIQVSPGPATLAVGGAEINVTVSYTGDDAPGDNNSIQIEWGLDGGSYTGSNTPPSHPASPYTYKITSLDNSELYQIKVTVTDEDNATATIKEITGRKPYNPLIHNAVSTGSGADKWGSGWGITGGQYGEFGCGTCHERKSGNIKRVRKDWSDDTLHGLPVHENSEAIDFQDNQDGTAHYANNDSTDHETSNRICEACHTKTKHHQYDMSNEDISESELDHKSTQDCISCHKHSSGFAIGSCSNCHGGSQSGDTEKNFWPDDADETAVNAGTISDSGEHLAHITILAQREYGYNIVQLLNSSSSQDEQQALCNYCHANPGNDADHAEGSVAETRFLQIYDDTTPDSDADFSSASCSQIDCHNNTSISVAWYGDVDSSCTMCHATGGTLNPTSGLHNETPAVTGKVHDGDIDGGCVACHKTLEAQSTHINGNSQGGFGDVVAMGLDNTIYTQTADDTGTCTNTNCHFKMNNGVDGSSDDWAHEWNSTAGFYTDATTACAGCHGDWTNNWNNGVTHRTTVGTEGTHGDSITDTDISCGECHVIDSGSYDFTFSTADWSQASETSHHGNGTIEINSKGSYMKDTTRLCDACHKSVNAKHEFEDTAWAVNATIVGDDISASCSACHGGDLGGTEDAFWPIGNIDGEDTSGNHPISGNDTGEHLKHMTRLAAQKYGHTSIADLLNSGTSSDQQIVLCSYCHPNPGGDANHNKTDDVGDIGNFLKMNGATDGTTAGAYDTGADNCSNVDCHNSKATGEWYNNSSFDCMLCHTTGPGNTSAVIDPKSGLHYDANPGDIVLHNGNFNVTANCLSCHTDTPSSGHFNSVGDATDDETYNFQSSTITVKLNTTGNATDDTCAADCHNDGGAWYRLWSADAFGDPTVVADQALPANCNVCHGQFGAWAEGSSHASKSDGTTSTDGSSHNSSGGEGEACDNCHGFPDANKHENDLITMVDDGSNVEVTEGSNGVYCKACHNEPLALPSDISSHVYAQSVFTMETLDWGTIPEGNCYGGTSGCHGDAVDHYWPAMNSIDPADYPNRDGAHSQHNITIGTMIAKYDPTLGGTIGAGTYNTTDNPRPPEAADFNRTCVYCHSTTANHTVSSETAPADVYNDEGTDNESFVFTLDNPYNIGEWYPLDSDGTYAAFDYSDLSNKPGTCSNIDCHANAPYTPGWYGDYVAPGVVTSLTSRTHTPDVPAGTHIDGVTDTPYSVQLSWKAPGDDSALDGTAYEYEIRYSTDENDLTTANFNADPNGDTIKIAQPPTVRRYNNDQFAIVEGLASGSYYFGIRTLDEAGNASAVVTTGPVSSHPDDVVPIFFGADTVTTSPEPNAVELRWDAARDHTLPITYNVLWTDYDFHAHFANGGSVPTSETCYDNVSAEVACDGDERYTVYTATTGALNYQVNDLHPGVLYTFLVQAEDGATNREDNHLSQMGMGQTLPTVPLEFATYYANSSSALVTTGYPGADSFSLNGGSTLTWALGSGYPVDTLVKGLTFELFVDNPNRAGASLNYALGSMSGTTFTPLPHATYGANYYETMTIGRKADRVVKFNVSEYEDTFSGGGNSLAFRVTNNSGTDVSVDFGEPSTKGLLNVIEQEVNHAPTGVAISFGSVTDGNVPISWSSASDLNGDTIHYDIYGSIDDGGNGYDVNDIYPYIIASGLDNSSTQPVNWDTYGDRIALDAAKSVGVIVVASDGYEYMPFTNYLTVDNSIDNIAPGKVDDLAAETRPKQGTAYLTWTSVGDDGDNHGSRAAYYDIRYSTSAITDDVTFNTAEQAHGEPSPNFSGELEGFELVGMDPEVDYYIAMKVADESENVSVLSNVVDTITAGAKCGICHSTPPDEPDTFGTHEQHGYTIPDCVKCHGTQVAGFTLRHYDGVVKLGFGKDSGGNRLDPVAETINGDSVEYWQNNGTVDVLVYEDTDGGGGFYGNVPGATDDGTCMGFVSVNASGCHGSYAPTWGEQVTREAKCADCHGDLTRTDDLYDRPYDGTVANDINDDKIADANEVPDDIKASPPIDNHGYDGTGSTEAERKLVGTHLKHLNSSFRYAKGDNCRLCHENNIHADGITDVSFTTGAGDTAKWTPGTATSAGTCSGTSTSACHGPRLPAEDPKWDSTLDISCDSCHDMIAIKATNSGVIPHTKGKGGADVECEYCHFAGHPQNGSADLVLIPNNPIVGIAYKSGGIHLKASPGHDGSAADYGPYTREAELCWGCHNDNGISEWGTNTKTNPGAVDYNYGAVEDGTNPVANWVKWDGIKWVGNTWRSPVANFAYKEGTIQSTHSANQIGTGQLTGTDFGYAEDVDIADNIRCSWCHDVHDMNLTDRDTMSGAPFLRGTWRGNPYPEDGAPWSKDYVVPSYRPTDGSSDPNLFDAVPRGGTSYTEQGGYYIDQNSGWPTDGWTLDNSAGLCLLCHKDVDNLDQTLGENLWLGTNGHSNSALGGTFTNKANIFTQGVGKNRPEPTKSPDTINQAGKVGSDYDAYGNLVPNMAFLYQGMESAADVGAGYRGRNTTTDTGKYAPQLRYDHPDSTRPPDPHAYTDYDWGATVDAGTVDVRYHQFSCSKCHNPHASRLPKLMITNCLDVEQNTWDDAKSSSQNTYDATALRDVDKGSTGATGLKAGYWASAQNCHRYTRPFTGYDPSDQGGWNKVTPWDPSP